MFATQQRSFDDLGTPLHDVTFCVLDVETTGGSPAEHAITEIGAVKFRGGELLGHFETLVNPGMAIPPLITVLTGITEAMVLPAPKIAEVLPHFLEFLGDSVIVGHNVRFDISFFDAALVAHGFEALSNRRTDTLALARRLVRDEVPNLKLGTLARHLRVPTEPNHRAMADARATAEVFHVLLERAATFGVLGLDDLIGLPSMHAHPSAQKLGLTASLPRSPGVYIFRDRAGRPLYVGKATNLRARVRSYFSGDDRRKIPQLLREVDRIDHIVCHDPIEAAVREIRLIQQWQPRFNRQGKLTRRYTYMKLTDERFPRIITTRVAKAGDGIYLGPLPSRRSAELVREAIETVVPLRRCTTRLSRRTPLPVCDGACTAAQLGVTACPCAGTIDDDTYALHVDTVRRALVGGEPHLLLDPLAQRMHELAAAERFEEAAATRDRLEALARALRRRDAIDTLRATERLVLHDDTGARLEFRHGRLILEAGPGRRSADDIVADDLAVPPGHDDVDELVLAAGFVARAHQRWKLRRSDGTLASPLPRVPKFEPLGRARR